MRTYIIKRLLLIVPTLVGVTLVIFCMTRLAPGDPAASKLGVGGGGNMGSQDVAKEFIEKFHKDWNLDKPVLVQYLLWVEKLVKLDFGKSYKDKKQVVDKIAERLPVTVTLNLIAFFLIYLIAIPIGIFAAKFKGTWAEKGVSLILFVLYSLPNFFVATLCILYFCNAEAFYNWFPVTGLKSDKYDAEEVLSFGPLPVANGDLRANFPMPYHGELKSLSAELWGSASEGASALVSVELDGIDVEGGVVELGSQPAEANIEGSPVTGRGTFSKGARLDIEVSSAQGMQARQATIYVEVVRRASFIEWLYDRLWHLVLPVFCLTYGGLAYISRQMRAALLEVIRQDYVRTARAKGLSEWVVIFKHALRNSLIPIITLFATLLPSMIAGSVIIERIFTIQGLGLLSFESILTRDYNVILAIFTISSFLTMLGILIADILYALVNPTIKLR